MKTTNEKNSYENNKRKKFLRKQQTKRILTKTKNSYLRKQQTKRILTKTTNEKNYL